MNTPTNPSESEVGRACEPDVPVPIAPTSPDAPNSGGAIGTSRSTSTTSQTLQLALEQLHAALKKFGAAQSENLITGEKSGYAQFVAALEKLSKMALDWEERKKAQAENASAKPPGYSPETQREMELKIEGSPAPTTG